MVRRIAPAVIGLTALLGAGCAGSPGPAGLGAMASAGRYGMEQQDVMQALDRGEGHQALAYYEAEARDREHAGEHTKAATARTAALIISYYLGMYQRAIRAGSRSVELLKLGPSSEWELGKEAQTRSWLASAYMAVGDPKEAERHYQTILALAGSMSAGGRQYWTGLAHINLARVALRRRDYRDALERAKDGIRIMEDREARVTWSRVLRFHTRRQVARGNVFAALAEWGLGNLSGAEEYMRTALRIASDAGASDTEVSAATQLGHVLLARRDYSRAATQLEEALALATKRGRLGTLVTIHAGIGQAAAAQGRPEVALAAFRRSLGLVEDLRGQLQEAGFRSGFVEDKQEIYHGAVRAALALERPADAFAFAERARARGFLDLLGSQTTLSKGKTRALVAEEVRLRAQLGEARAMASAVPGETEGDPLEARRQLDAAEQAYRAFLDQARKQNLEQVSLMTVEPMTLSEVQTLLPQGTTLLEYLVTDAETILWVVDRSRAEVLRLPIPRTTLVGDVRDLREAIETRAPQDQAQRRARALYDQLLAPARPHLRGDRLLIVPHDVLHYLPFGALRAPEGRWLVEDYTLATLPSASVLKFLQEKEGRASRGALALGNPELGPALNLRYAEREARVVGERYPGATVLVRQEATEAKAKALSSSAGLLHFATHGELNEKEPLSSALLLVPEGQEDGRLEVREILGLDLHARLVVLSACETGLGQLSRGDELVGLQRAFLYAGTPAVVTTLWKVDDRASFRLMEAFYDALATAGPAAALRQAQRATMREFPHPFAWAGFGLTGTPK